MAEAGGGWSNDIEDDNDMGLVWIRKEKFRYENYFRNNITIPPVIRRGTRRAAEEIVATGIVSLPK